MPAPFAGRFAPEAKGGGITDVMDAVYHREGKLRPRVAVVKTIASALSRLQGCNVTVVPLYPQYSESTTESVADKLPADYVAVKFYAARALPDAPEVVCLDFGQKCTGELCPMFGLPRRRFDIADLRSRGVPPAAECAGPGAGHRRGDPYL